MIYASRLILSEFWLNKYLDTCTQSSDIYGKQWFKSIIPWCSSFLIFGNKNLFAFSLWGNIAGVGVLGLGELNIKGSHKFPSDILYQMMFLCTTIDHSLFPAAPKDFVKD